MTGKPAYAGGISLCNQLTKEAFMKNALLLVAIVVAEVLLEELRAHFSD